MNQPTQDIIDNHILLVSLLIHNDVKAERVEEIRRAVKEGNRKYHELELIYVQMMEDAILQE